eukprot:6202748-Amphidinium_carterae.4
MQQYSVLVEDRRGEETPSGGDTPGDRTEQATDEKTEEDESLISPIIVDDRQVEETPVAAE